MSGRRGFAPGGPVKRWLGVLSLLVIVSISYVDRINVSVLITDKGFTDHFGITGERAWQGALMTLFLAGYGLAALLLTPWYEARLGVRRGLFAGLVIWSLCTLLVPYAAGAVVLLCLRFLLGGGEGPLFSLKTMYVREHFAEGELGKPNAVTSLGVSLGTALGIPAVTFAVYHAGWHGSFLALAALNVVVGIPLVALFVRGRSTACGTRRRARDRLTTALRTPGLGWVLLIEVATLGYLWGSSSWLPSYLLEERHFSLAQMGILASMPFVVSLLSGFLGGYALDRLPVHRHSAVLIVGSSGTILCVTAVLFTGQAWLAAGALILANGFWGLQGPVIPTLVQRYASQGTVGSTYGSPSTALGQAGVGSWILTRTRFAPRQLRAGARDHQTDRPTRRQCELVTLHPRGDPLWTQCNRPTASFPCC